MLDTTHLCAGEHETDWWPFSACLFRRQKALKVDATFETTVRACSERYLNDYSFDDLKACYEGNEGHELMTASYARSAAMGVDEVFWVYVNNVPVESGNFKEDELWSSAILQMATTGDASIATAGNIA
eukprot:NODE_13927_length_1138_cov_3.031652.p1 GENE.NODE_13927_length_1138_cov_3.031652~~NODE_13927_length_1138_cov_3.031652.p1  ORF type:complete len:128 (+),score=42.67 NODE_13927_length_1138_cov_3.031652:351-734(+)